MERDLSTIVSLGPVYSKANLQYECWGTEPWLGWLALQVWRLPTRVRASLNAGFPTGAEACVCVHVWVRVVWVPRYGVSRDYSGSLVCVESGQRGRLKILHDSPMLLGAFKKKNMNAGYSVSAGQNGHLVLKCTIQEWRLQSWNTWQPRPMMAQFSFGTQF